MKKIIFWLLFFILTIIPFFSFAALININTADSVDLDKIPEVGPAIAARIIAYRTSNGSFKNIEEIKNVSGIGDATFLRMKDFITVGTSEVSDGNSSGTSSEIVDQASTLSSSGNSSGSVHTSEKNLDNYKTEDLKIGAGRERLATVRTPILFSASQNKNGVITNYFNWSFGDGTSAVGAKVYHTYDFPGRYNVVLNGNIDNKEEAVARTVVLVSENNIKITKVDFVVGFVEITNNSDKEQNLNNWSLLAGDKKYIFPIDTIISPNTAIKISLKAIGFDGQVGKDILLIYPDGLVSGKASLAETAKAVNLKKQLIKLRQERGDFSVGQFVNNKTSNINSSSTIPKNVIVLAKEPSWFEKIKNAIFE